MSPIRTPAMRARGARDEALKGAGMRCRVAKPTPALRASWRSLQALPGVRLPSLHRMAATACAATLWPAGAFAHAYDANRKAASSRRTQWQFASEDSWPNAPVGRLRFARAACGAPPKAAGASVSTTNDRRAPHGGTPPRHLQKTVMSVFGVFEARDLPRFRFHL
jgi:hypothetical protein